MPSDISFESKFASLVDAQLNERLPSLTDYRVGFQVIDKTEDDQKGVGIAAFILNGLWLYIPVFFIKGDLKGFELLYIKQKDLFVPSMDNWVAALSQQGLTMLGSGKPQTSDGTDQSAAPEDAMIYDAYSHFGKSAQDMSTFDLMAAGKAVAEKLAADLENANSLIGVDEWRKMRNPDQAKAQAEGGVVGLAQGLEHMDKRASQWFVNTMLNRPAFANALFQHYTVEQVQKIAEDCVRRIGEAPLVKSEVTFITDMTSKEAAELTDKEKSLVTRNGVYVKDDRTNLSNVYHEQPDASVLQNPTEQGIYDVLLPDGKYRQYIVLVPQSMIRGESFWRRHSQNVDRSVALIDIDSPQEYICQKSGDIFCKPATEIPSKAYKGIQGGLKASLRTLRDVPDNTRLLFCPPTLRDPAIETRLTLKERDDAGNLYVILENSTGSEGAYIGAPDRDSKRTLQVEFTGPEGRLRISGSCLYVPEDTRVYRESEPWQWYTTTEGERKRRGPKNHAFGNLDTINHLLYKSAGLQRLEVQHSGGTAQVSSVKGSTGLVDKLAALRHLVFDHGIGAGIAQQMLKDAAVGPHNTKAFMVKHAAPYDSRAYGDAQRPFMGGPSGKHENATITKTQVKGGDPLTVARSSDNSAMMPQQAIQKAQEAAASGIKEVFDVSVLSGLVDRADITELRKDYIKDMIKGMDKVGRMLFLFYWHFDEFEDRYGHEDMTKLEDTLKDVFNKIGDLVLFLKEKTAYNPDAAEALFGNLSEDVGQVDGTESPA